MATKLFSTISPMSGLDFRQLIKVLAEAFRVRIEMKQIGARTGSRTHRRYRPLRTRTLLRYVDDELRLCFYQCSPFSGHLINPAETCRTMCQAEMLPEL